MAMPGPKSTVLKGEIVEYNPTNEVGESGGPR